MVLMKDKQDANIWRNAASSPGVLSDNLDSTTLELMRAKAMRDKYRAIVVGAGRIGLTLGFDRLREQPASHARALAAHPRIELAGAVDVDPKKLALWRKTYPRTATHLDLDEAMEGLRPDIVVIAVPEAAHADVAGAVFAHRPRLVILEKPVAPNLAAAEAIRGSPFSLPHRCYLFPHRCHRWFPSSRRLTIR